MALENMIVPQIWEHDGYAGESIFKSREELGLPSMYFDHVMDQQYKVPITPPEELIEKYNLPRN